MTKTQVRLFASSRSWIAGEALRQFYAAANLEGVRIAAGFPDLHPGSGTPVGAAFVLVNNHDPVRLQKQFAELWPETFAWKYLAQGPEEFCVKITKLKPLGAPAVPVATSCREH